MNTFYVCLSYFFKNNFNNIPHLQLKMLEFETQEAQIVLSGEHSLEEAVNLLEDRQCSEWLYLSL